MRENADGTARKFFIMTAKLARMNIAVMAGIIFSAAEAILLSPPQVIANTPAARINPVIAGLSPNEPESESAAAFAWVILPMPSEAMTNRTQKIFAMCLNPSPRSI